MLEAISTCWGPHMDGFRGHTNMLACHMNGTGCHSNMQGGHMHGVGRP